MVTVAKIQGEIVMEIQFGQLRKSNWLLQGLFSENGETLVFKLRGHYSDHHSAAAQKPTLIVPDKDADGLSSGVIIHRTLVQLGLDPEFLDVHLVQKGSNVHEEDERKLMLEKKPSFIFILDQGSRDGPPVIDDQDAKSLIIDHHLSDEFPKDAQVS
jgi:hypothetical protein